MRAYVVIPEQNRRSRVVAIGGEAGGAVHQAGREGASRALVVTSKLSERKGLEITRKGGCFLLTPVVLRPEECMQSVESRMISPATNVNGL